MSGRTHFVRYHVPDLFDNDPNEYVVEEWTVGSFAVTGVLNSPAGFGITVGQTIRVAEPVGLVDYGSGGFIKSVIEDCAELKSGASYVLFVAKETDGTYTLDNLNQGRFNTDGTDPEDEIGGGVSPDGMKSDKQSLRDELTAQYGVAFSTLPGADIIGRGQIRSGGSDGSACPRGCILLQTRVSVPQPAGTSVQAEKQAGDGTWVVVGMKSVPAEAQTATSPVEFYVPLPGYNSGSYRVRVIGNGHTSNYSTQYNVP